MSDSTKDYGDERYVRLLTRDTPGWLGMPWQGRALLPLLLRKLDRSGVLEVGDEDLGEIIAAMVHVPSEVVSVGLAALLKRETIRVANGVLVAPNYLAIQETPKSDKERARESRERRRANAVDVTKLRTVTPPSRNVTIGHETSPDRDVSSLHTVPPVPGHTVPPVPAVQDAHDAHPTKPEKVTKRRAKTPYPADFGVSPEIAAMCRAEGLPDPHEVLRDFQGKALANDYLYADWEAAFRNWMRSSMTRRDYPPWAEPEAARPEILRGAGVGDRWQSRKRQPRGYDDLDAIADREDAEAASRQRSRLTPLPPEPEPEPMTPEERADIERHLAGGGRSSLLLEVLEDDRNHVIPKIPKIAGVAT